MARLDFGGDTDPCVDLGSFSAIPQHYEIGHTAIGVAKIKWVIF